MPMMDNYEINNYKHELRNRVLQMPYIYITFVNVISYRPQFTFKKIPCLYIIETRRYRAQLSIGLQYNNKTIAKL